jgi:hypothetical protein
VVDIKDRPKGLKGGGDMDELFALAKTKREKQEEKVLSPPEEKT